MNMILTGDDEYGYDIYNKDVIDEDICQYRKENLQAANRGLS